MTCVIREACGSFTNSKFQILNSASASARQRASASAMVAHAVAAAEIHWLTP